MPQSIHALFDAAVAAKGATYRGLERELRARGDETLGEAQRRLQDDEPVARLLARVLLVWLRPGGERLDRTLDFLDEEGAHAAGATQGTPPPFAVAKTLAREQGAAPAELLALRLVKDDDLHPWRMMTTLFYLRRHPTSHATRAVLRYLAHAQLPSWREDARQTIRAIGDPKIEHKAAAELARLRALGHPAPAELIELAGRLA